MVRIQTFLTNFIKSILSLIKIVLYSRFSVQIKKSPQSKECVILANGPSLNDAINKQSLFLKNKALYCVNLFALTSYYEQFQPSGYVISAPEFFINDVSEEVAKTGEHLLKTINQKTTWDLTLYILNEASKNTDWQQEIKKNPRIKIVFFNQTPVEGWKWFRHIFFKWNLGLPRPHNVVVPSIMVALNSGYRIIYLMGVDHSWLPEIMVDENNRVFLTQKHFYDAQSATPQIMRKKGKGERRLHEVLMKFVYSFEAYFILRTYAESLGAKIFNTTKDSFIDAFDRMTIGEIGKS
ncbi:MAG: hypothetical protein COX07_03555 [Bacteroidetes bacterium CG23_combo_of_CG06-09_8_20_14_all_32_9]|nr:MAG: hypothetical protein COX07_03555 [Bacteroidetes bacterium CG23_combo_of_CG06-09_8_20_14_all_32_9]